LPEPYFCGSNPDDCKLSTHCVAMMEVVVLNSSMTVEGTCAFQPECPSRSGPFATVNEC